MWLLEASIKAAIEQAYKNGVVPTAEQQARFEARYNAVGAADTSRILRTAGDVAQINIIGTLTPSPDFIAMLFGGGNVTYPEIISALAEIETNSDITRAEIRIDSPGGHVNGLFDAIAALQAFSKPLKAVVTGQASSAAYALVSQADEIVAANRAVMVGSIGIAASFEIDPNIVDIASTDAPKKRPDLSTAEGQAVIREELDGIHNLFAEAIAAGRDTTVEKVNTDFGQGARVLAEAALKRGMVDAIAGAPLRVVQSANTNATSSGGDSENGNMDLNKLRAEHPAVYDAAVKAGIDQERDRVSAHLTLGKASGDMDTAIKAVEEGSAMTAALQAKYLAAGMNRNDQNSRQADDAAAAAAANGAGDGDGAGDKGAAAEVIAKGIEERFGRAAASA